MCLRCRGFNQWWLSLRLPMEKLWVMITLLPFFLTLNSGGKNMVFSIPTYLFVHLSYACLYACSSLFSFKIPMFALSLFFSHELWFMFDCVLDAFLFAFLLLILIHWRIVMLSLSLSLSLLCVMCMCLELRSVIGI